MSWMRKKDLHESKELAVCGVMSVCVMSALESRERMGEWCECRKGECAMNSQQPCGWLSNEERATSVSIGLSPQIMFNQISR